MKEKRVANRYAKALFDLAVERNILEKIKADSELIYNVCLQNHEFILMLRSPIIKESKKLLILKNVFEKSINEMSFKFLVIITRNRRESLIMDISEQFIEIYKKFKNILSANLSTAVEIDSEIRENIIRLLKKHTKSEIELSEDTNEELIGGFVLSFDDKQYDASVLRQIKDLHKEFDINIYEKGF